MSVESPAWAEVSRLLSSPLLASLPNDASGDPTGATAPAIDSLRWLSTFCDESTVDARSDPDRQAARHYLQSSLLLSSPLPVTQLPYSATSRSTAPGSTLSNAPVPGISQSTRDAALVWSSEGMEGLRRGESLLRLLAHGSLKAFDKAFHAYISSPSPPAVDTDLTMAIAPVVASFAVPVASEGLARALADVLDLDGATDGRSALSHVESQIERLLEGGNAALGQELCNLLLSSALHSSQAHLALAASAFRKSATSQHAYGMPPGSLSEHEKAWLGATIGLVAAFRVALRRSDAVSEDTLASMASSTLVEVIVPVTQVFSAAWLYFCPMIAYVMGPKLASALKAILQRGAAHPQVQHALDTTMASYAEKQAALDAESIATNASSDVVGMVFHPLPSPPFSTPVMDTTCHLELHQLWGQTEDPSALICRSLLCLASACVCISIASTHALPASSLELEAADNTPETVRTLVQLTSSLSNGGSVFAMASPTSASSSIASLLPSSALCFGITHAQLWPEYAAVPQQSNDPFGFPALVSAFMQLPVFNGVKALPSHGSDLISTLFRGQTARIIPTLPSQKASLSELREFAASLFIREGGRVNYGAPSQRGLLLRALLQAQTPLKGLAVKKRQYTVVEVLFIAACLLHTAVYTQTSTPASDESDPTATEGSASDSKETSLSVAGPWLELSWSVQSLEQAGTRVALSANGAATGIDDASTKRIAAVSVPGDANSIWGRVTELRKWIGDRCDEYRSLGEKRSETPVPTPGSATPANPTPLPSVVDTASPMVTSQAIPGFPTSEDELIGGLVSRLHFLAIQQPTCVHEEDAPDVAASLHAHLPAVSKMACGFAASAGDYPAGLPAQKFLFESPAALACTSHAQGVATSITLYAREGWIVPLPVVESLCSIRSIRASWRVAGLTSLLSLSSLASTQAPWLLREVFTACGGSGSPFGLVTSSEGAISALQRTLHVHARFPHEGLSSVPLPLPSPTFKNVFSALHRNVSTTSSSLEQRFDWSAAGFGSEVHASCNASLITHTAAFRGVVAASCALMLIREHHDKAKLVAQAMSLMLQLQRFGGRGEGRRGNNHASAAAAPNAISSCGFSSSTVSASFAHLQGGSRQLHEQLQTIVLNLQQHAMITVAASLCESTRAMAGSDDASLRGRRRGQPSQLQQVYVDAAAFPGMSLLATTQQDGFGRVKTASKAFISLMQKTGCLNALLNFSSPSGRPALQGHYNLLRTRHAMHGYLVRVGYNEATSTSIPWSPVSVTALQALLNGGILDCTQMLIYLLAGCFRVSRPSLLVEVLVGVGLQHAIPADLPAILSNKVSPDRITDDPAPSSATGAGPAANLLRHITNLAARIRIAVLSSQDEVRILTSMHDALLRDANVQAYASTVRNAAAAANRALNALMLASGHAESGADTDDVVEEVSAESTSQSVEDVSDPLVNSLARDSLAQNVTMGSSIAATLQPSALFSSWKAQAAMVADYLVRHVFIQSCADADVTQAFLLRVSRSVFSAQFMQDGQSKLVENNLYHDMAAVRHALLLCPLAGTDRILHMWFWGHVVTQASIDTLTAQSRCLLADLGLHVLVHTPPAEAAQALLRAGILRDRQLLQKDSSQSPSSASDDHEIPQDPRGSLTDLNVRGTHLTSGDAAFFAAMEVTQPNVAPALVTTIGTNILESLLELVGCQYTACTAALLRVQCVSSSKWIATPSNGPSPLEMCLSDRRYQQSVSGTARYALRLMMSSSNPWCALASQVVHDAIIAGAQTIKAIGGYFTQALAVVSKTTAEYTRIRLSFVRTSGALAVLGGGEEAMRTGSVVRLRPSNSSGHTNESYIATESVEQVVVIDPFIDAPAVVAVAHAAGSFNIRNMTWQLDARTNAQTRTRKDPQILPWPSTEGSSEPVVVLQYIQDNKTYLDVLESSVPTCGAIKPSSVFIDAIMKFIDCPISTAAFIAPDLPKDVQDASSTLSADVDGTAPSMSVHLSEYSCALAELQLQSVLTINTLLRLPATESSDGASSFAASLLAAGLFTKILNLSLQAVPSNAGVPFRRIISSKDILHDLVWHCYLPAASRSHALLPTTAEVCGAGTAHGMMLSKASRGTLSHALDFAAPAAPLPKATRRTRRSAAPANRQAAPARVQQVSVDSTPPDNAVLARWDVAGNLVSILGTEETVSRRLCYNALAQHEDNADVAINWLFEHMEMWPPAPPVIVAASPSPTRQAPSALSPDSATPTEAGGLVESDSSDDDDGNSGAAATGTHSALHAALKAMASEKRINAHRPRSQRRASIDDTIAAESAADAVRFDECITEGIAFNEPLIIDMPPKLPPGYAPASKYNVMALAASRSNAGAGTAVAPIVLDSLSSNRGDDKNDADDADPDYGAPAIATLGNGGGDAATRAAVNVVEDRSFTVSRVGVHPMTTFPEMRSQLHAVTPACALESLKPGTLLWISSSPGDMVARIRSLSGFFATFECTERDCAVVRRLSGALCRVPKAAVRLPVSVFGLQACVDMQSWACIQGCAVGLPAPIARLCGAASLRTTSALYALVASVIAARLLLTAICGFIVNRSPVTNAQDALLPLDCMQNWAGVITALKLAVLHEDTLANDSHVLTLAYTNKSDSLMNLVHSQRAAGVWDTLLESVSRRVHMLRQLVSFILAREEDVRDQFYQSQWTCPMCTFINSNCSTCAVCKRTAPVSSSSRPQGTLAEELVKESLLHLGAAADACAIAGERASTKGSSHPLSSQTAPLEMGTVAFSDATVLWVTFDTRCETDASDESSYVEFYAEDTSLVNAPVKKLANGATVRGELVAHLYGPPHVFMPFMVRANKLTYVISRGHARRGVSGDGGWGAQFTVTPLSAMLWGNETEAANSSAVVEGRAASPQRATHPSLLWGCWLLEYLISGALGHRQLLRGLVHSGRLTTLCVDYLRTTAAPNKDRIASLLHKIVSSSEYTLLTPLHCEYEAAGTPGMLATIARMSTLPSFNTKEEAEILQRITVIPLRYVEIIRRLLNERLAEANNIYKGAALLLPRPLQRLVELVATIESALRRARVQLHLLVMTSCSMYAHVDARTYVSPLLLPIPPAATSEARLVLSIAARCDRDIPHAPYFTLNQTSPPPPSSWSPPLIVHPPPAIDVLIVSQALLHLRDILLALVTRRRVPDAWMIYALLQSLSSKPVQSWTAAQITSTVTQDKLAWAHWTNGKFETQPNANEAICGWIAKWAARKGLASALDTSPADMEVSEPDSATYPILGALPLPELRLRAAFLLAVNSLLRKVLPYVDMSQTAESDAIADNAAVARSSQQLGSEWHKFHRLPVGAIVRRLPSYIMVDAKERLITEAIDASVVAGQCTLKVCLDNRAALACSEMRIIEPLRTLCTFAQFYRFMVESRISDRQLRLKMHDREYLFEVQYVGLAGMNEEGLDWGGLYRDSLVRMMDDLFSTEQQGIDLFSLTPNAASMHVSEEAATEVAAAVQQYTATDGSFVPNPKYSNAATSGNTPVPVALSMFEWVGKLMGISIRTRACLDFDLAPLVWKLLVGDDVDVEDIIVVDAKLGSFLRAVQTFTDDARTASAGAGEARDADAAFVERFGQLFFVLPDPAAAAAQNKVVASTQLMSAALIPGGSSTKVTFSSRHRYIAAIIAAVCDRYRGACNAMRRGLTCIIPDRALRLASWRDLQRLVCGESEIDLVVLRNNTTYDSRGVYSDAHPNIKFFWSVMETLTPEQKRNFVRFAWGRSKLPRGTWPKNYRGEQVKFKIVPKLNYDGLPLAHTCFFLIELPTYQSIDIMRQRLLTAITYGAGEGFLLA